MFLSISLSEVSLFFSPHHHSNTSQLSHSQSEPKEKKETETKGIECIKHCIQPQNKIYTQEEKNVDVEEWGTSRLGHRLDQTLLPRPCKTSILLLQPAVQVIRSDMVSLNIDPAIFLFFRLRHLRPLIVVT